MEEKAHSGPDAPEHVFLLFVDGLGIGPDQPAANPCTNPQLSLFRNFLHENYPKILDPRTTVLGLDATLGVPGLPQSATGQTALLTGVNAAQVLGRHLNAFPNRQLREIIARESILTRFVKKGLDAAFLNTFRPPFFDYNPYDILHALSVTSVANLYAGLPFFNLDDLWAGRSVYQDITNESLRLKGFDAPLYEPDEAGEIIGRQLRHYHFSLFEFFQTDRAGHSQQMERAVAELMKLEEFLQAILQTANLDDTLVVVTSDHGNIEDLAFRGHTRHPAMTLVFGKGAGALSPGLHSIQDITPGLCAFFSGHEENAGAGTDCV